MKTASKTIYVAFDDTEFETERECRSYERANVARRLADLNDEQIAAALSGADPDLGEAFEQFGDECREARLERGGHKRRPKGSAAGETQPGDDTSGSMVLRVDPPVAPASDDDTRAAQEAA